MFRSILAIPVLSLMISGLAYGQSFIDLNLTTYDAALLQNQHPSEVISYGRAEGDTIWYDDFADLSNWTLGTTGAFGTADSLWEHTLDGPYGTFSGTWGDIQSATASNGWAMFDSDGNGSANPTTGAPTGVEFDTYIQLANPVDLSSFSVVGVKFTEFYKELQSETYLDVSTDGVNWTSIQLHVGFGVNDQTAQDAVLYQDITPLAAGQAAVWVRLRYSGFGYFWQVDDFMFVEGVENDLELTRIFTGNNEVDYLYSKKPLSQVTETELGVVVTNIGGLSQSNVVVDWEITDGSNVLASGTESITAALAGADADTVFFNTGFTPTAVGEYIVNMTVSSDEVETNLADNEASESFEVTDYIWAHDYEDLPYTAFGYAANSTTTGGEAFEMGANYFCQVDGDFIYAVVFALGNNTTASSITLKVYEDDPTSGPVSETVYDIVQSQLSTSSNVKFITVVLDDPVEMLAGSVYRATVAIEGGDAGYIMGNLKDDNDAGQSVYFAFEDTWYNWIGLTTSMRLNTNPNIAGVEDDVTTYGFGIYPNPATDNVRFRIDPTAGVAAINLYDVAGQLVKTETVSSGVTRFNLDISELQPGVYMAYVQTANGPVAQRLIVQ